MGFCTRMRHSWLQSWPARSVSQSVEGIRRQYQQTLTEAADMENTLQWDEVCHTSQFNAYPLETTQVFFPKNSESGRSRAVARKLLFLVFHLTQFIHGMWFVQWPTLRSRFYSVPLGEGEGPAGILVISQLSFPQFSGYYCTWVKKNKKQVFEVQKSSLTDHSEIHK